jgi:hypothetical protein
MKPPSSNISQRSIQLRRRQTTQSRAPGRIEMTRPPTKLRNFGIGCAVLLALLAGGAGYMLIFQHIGLQQLFIMGAVVFLLTLFMVPTLLPRFIQEATDAINDPDRRHYKENQIKAREEQRRESQAATATTSAPDSIGDPPSAVLGGANVGTLAWCIGPYAILPAPELAKHGVIVGASGTGKTISLLRLAYLAAVVYGYRVYFVDGKGDRDTAAQFLAVMRQAGVQAAMFPRQPFGGWEGDGNAILNRLMSVLDFSEPYYENVCKALLTSVCIQQGRPPRSSAELLHRLDALQAGSTDRDTRGVLLRYRAFFGPLAGALDGGFSWENTQAAYLLLDSLALKKEAASLGRFLIEDFAHYAARRKQPGRDLLIVDEYSAISTGTDAANLIERVRSYNCAVVLSSQSYEGLGEEREAERILSAANWLLLHRTANPERLTSRAGTTLEEKEQYQLGGFTHGAARASMEEEDAVHPDEARRLRVGEALFIAHGRYIRLQVAQPPATDPQIVSRARAWIDQPQTAPAPAIQAQTMTTGPYQAPASAPASTHYQQPQPSQPLVRQIKPTTGAHQAQPSAPLRLPQRQAPTGPHPTERPGQAPQKPEGPELL